ncbi:hypothetical protein BGY98DRAFT_535289 [Russula aff. rugulosa BPL654]|nr:hypothetical protein BGY98DRAFT_535289 [Russula aff. rugulosa BPL654]
MPSSKYVNTPERRRSKILPMLGRFSSRDHRTRDVGRISRLFAARLLQWCDPKWELGDHHPILCRSLLHRSTTCCCDHAQAHLEGAYQGWYIDLPTVITLLQTPCLAPQSQLDISDPCMRVITVLFPIHARTLPGVFLRISSCHHTRVSINAPRDENFKLLHWGTSTFCFS